MNPTKLDIINCSISLGSKFNPDDKIEITRSDFGYWLEYLDSDEEYWLTGLDKKNYLFFISDSDIKSFLRNKRIDMI